MEADHITANINTTSRETQTVLGRAIIKTTTAATIMKTTMAAVVTSQAPDLTIPRTLTATGETREHQTLADKKEINTTMEIVTTIEAAGIMVIGTTMEAIISTISIIKWATPRH